MWIWVRVSCVKGFKKFKECLRRSYNVSFRNSTIWSYLLSSNLESKSKRCSTGFSLGVLKKSISPCSGFVEDQICFLLETRGLAVFCVSVILGVQFEVTFFITLCGVLKTDLSFGLFSFALWTCVFGVMFSLLENAGFLRDRLGVLVEGNFVGDRLSDLAPKGTFVGGRSCTCKQKKVRERTKIKFGLAVPFGPCFWNRLWIFVQFCYSFSPLSYTKNTKCQQH